MSNGAIKGYTLHEVLTNPDLLLVRQRGAKVVPHTHFSRNLTIMRRLRGLSQKQMAAIIGVPAGRYQTWESTHSYPAFKDLTKFMDGLQYPYLYNMISGPMSVEDLQTYLIISGTIPLQFIDHFMTATLSEVWDGRAKQIKISFDEQGQENID